MKYKLAEFKKLIPNLHWTSQELAEQLTNIGHETEMTGDTLNIVSPSNRKDCQQLPYLVFDLAAFHPELEPIDKLVNIEKGHAIPVNVGNINKLLGSTISEQEMKQLERLGFVVEKEKIIAPRFRVDVQTRADIAEEIFRFIGAAGIKMVPLSKKPLKESNQYQFELQVRASLARIGLNETRTISFTSQGQVEIKNPFSNKEPFLRPTLLDGLLRTLAKNPFLKRCGFFELGHVFVPQEQNKVGIILAGYKNIEPWITNIEQAIGRKVKFESVEQAKLAAFDVRQGKVGWTEIGIEDLQPTLKHLPKPILPVIQPISKFPPLVRDITVVGSINEADLVIKKLHELFNNLLIIDLVDTYTNNNQTNLTFRLIFQNLEHSFTENDISAIDQRLADYFNAAEKTLQ